MNTGNNKNLGNAFWMIVVLSSANVAHGADRVEMIAEARQQQVSVLREKGVNEGVGAFGMPMQQLVGTGLVSPETPRGQWQDPRTAIWTGEHGVASYDDFLANADAQRRAFIDYVQQVSEHIRINKPEISVAFEGHKLSIQDVVKMTAIAKPYELVEFVKSGDPEALNAAASRAGLNTGADLIRATALATTRDLDANALDA